MSKQNIDPPAEDSASEKESQNSQPKRCADVTQTKVEPCSFTNSGTQTPVCIPETRCPAPVCSQDVDCHDLYCTSETCKDEKSDEKPCCPTKKDDDNLEKKPSASKLDLEQSPCCKNKRRSIGQLDKEDSNHSQLKNNSRLNSALKQKGSNISQAQKTTRWGPDTSMASAQKNNTTVRNEDSDEEGSTCPRRPESGNETENPQILLPLADPKKSGPMCTETKKCKSAKCSKNIGENQDCPCHFPPAFSQFKCTGKISGNCSCAKFK